MPISFPAVLLTLLTTIAPKSRNSEIYIFDKNCVKLTSL